MGVLEEGVTVDDMLRPGYGEDSEDDDAVREATKKSIEIELRESENGIANENVLPEIHDG